MERRYLDRWYPLAVVRSNSSYTAYVAGRALASYSQDIGNAATTDGVLIGGFKCGEKFWGEIQEVAVIQAIQNATAINTNRLRDIPARGQRVYFKLAYSAAPAENLKNFVATLPPPGNPVQRPTPASPSSRRRTSRASNPWMIPRRTMDRMRSLP